MMDPINHFEIPTDDMDRAKKFYHSVFGWKIKTDENMDYTMVWTTDKVDEKGRTAAPGVIGGGLVPRGNAKNPVLVMTVKDIQASAEKVTEHGGKVLGEIQAVGDFGKYALFEDPEGNVLGIFQMLKEM